VASLIFQVISRFVSLPQLENRKGFPSAPFDFATTHTLNLPIVFLIGPIRNIRRPQHFRIGSISLWNLKYQTAPDSDYCHYESDYDCEPRLHSRNHQGDTDVLNCKPRGHFSSRRSCSPGSEL
jgi:hypothetical protein